MANREIIPEIQITHMNQLLLVGCIAQLAEHRSLAGELTLSFAWPAADG